MPAYQDYESTYWQVFSGLYEYSQRPLEQQSLELRLTSNEDSEVSWVAGLYWMEDDTSGLTVQNFSFNTYEYDATNTNETAAIFGQVTIPLSDDINVTAGIRYTEDKFDKSITSSDGAGGFYTLDAAAKFDKVTWKLGVDYKLNDSSLAYANLSTGYRQGGTDQSANTFEVFTYEPETLTSFEVGYKARALSDKLQYNISAFFYQWEEYQASYPVQLEGGFYETRTANVPGTTDIAGVEVETAWLLTDYDRLDFSLTYNYSSFADAQLYLNGTQDFFGNPLPPVDLNGIELPNAPKYTADLTYSRDWMLGSLGTLTTEASAKYNDGYYVDLLRFNYSEQENYMLYDASIKYFSPSNQWSLSLFGKNLSDEAVIKQANQAGPNVVGVIGNPRTYGISLNIDF